MAGLVPSRQALLQLQDAGYQASGESLLYLVKTEDRLAHDTRTKDALGDQHPLEELHRDVNVLVRENQNWQEALKESGAPSWSPAAWRAMMVR